MEQLFSRLRKADLVKGVRGPGGGYRIRQTPELISIASIIEAVNEPIDSTKCGGEENCQHDSICLTHDLWAGLSDHIQDYLSQITLADLIAQRDERRNIVKCSESIVKFEKPLKYG